MKILIIEDEILIQKSLKIFFEKNKFIVTATASGKEAIDLIKNENFDRILCDLMLQDISGFDIIEESKKKYLPDELKKRFIIMSAYSSAQITDKIKKYGCIFIRKPFTGLNDVINIILNS
jgi:DNA-binding response OmpR family regulator